MGLLLAAGRFDPERGHRFSTYAVWWVRHQCRRLSLRGGRQVPFPHGLSADCHKVASAQSLVRARTGASPSAEEIEAITGLSSSRVARARMGLSYGERPLDGAAAGGRSVPRQPDLAPSTSHDPVERIAWSDGIERVRQILPRLSAVERSVLTYRFGLGDAPVETLTQVGRRHGLSRERIRLIQLEALAKIRKKLRGHERRSGSSHR